MKSVYTCLAALLFLVPFSNAQQWTELDTLPADARYNASAFSAQGKGYLVFGTDGSTRYNDVWEYDADANSWTQKADFPGVPRSAAIALSLDSVAYAGLGWNGSSTFKDMYAYDPSSDTWTAIPDYPGNGGRNCLATANNGKLYVGGGHIGLSNPPYDQDFWCYDASTSTWTALGDLPFGPRVGGVAFGLDSLVYFGMGHDNTNDFNDIWSYNPSDSQWVQLTDTFPGLPRLQPSVFVVGNEAFVGGGFNIGNTDERYGDYYAYNPATGWSPVDSFAAGTRAHSRGFSIGSFGYLLTGTDSLGNLNDVWRYGTVQDSTPTNSINPALMNAFSVYPVPAHKTLTIEMKGLLQEASFVLTDLSGKVVLQQHLQHRQEQIRLHNLSAGAYQYAIITGEGRVNGKIIIAR